MQTSKIDKGIVIIKITPELEKSFTRHIKNIARHLRECDFNEISSATGKDPKEVILEATILSRERHIVMKREGSIRKRFYYIPIIIFGVADHPGIENAGIPWMVATDDIMSIQQFVIKQSLNCIDEMKKRYKYLINYVDQRNKDSISWLRDCGFTIYEPEPYGAEGLPFHKFDMKVA